MRYEDVLKGAEVHDQNAVENQEKIDYFLDFIRSASKSSYKETDAWWIEKFGLEEKTRGKLATELLNSESDPLNIILGCIYIGYTYAEEKLKDN